MGCLPYQRNLTNEIGLCELFRSIMSARRKVSRQRITPDLTSPHITSLITHRISSSCCREKATEKKVVEKQDETLQIP
jgi:hypothetical protein